MDRDATRSLDADELDDHLDGGRIVAWFRVDPMGGLLRALGAGAFVMTVGSVVMALSFARLGPGPVDFEDREALWLAFAVSALGIGTMLAGGLVAVFGLRRVLAEERYLALRTDGAYFRDGPRRGALAWSEVEQIRCEGSAVVFERHDGSRWVRAERFAGADAQALAKRCAEVRRKALFGLL